MDMPDTGKIIGKAKEGLTKKLGPLPAWGWGVVTAGAIWVWRGFTGRVGGGTSGGGSGATTDVGNAGYAVVPSLSGGGAPPPTPGYGIPEGSQSSIYINTPDFTVEGSEGAVKGFVDAWIASKKQPVTTGGGTPVPPKTTPKPATPVAKPPAKPVVPPKPAPKPARYYTVVKGDTLTKIGSKYGKTWQVIYNANKSVIGSNPDLIKPGQRLLIPY